MNTKALKHFSRTVVGTILGVIAVFSCLIGAGFAINYLYEYPVRWLGYLFLATRGAKDMGIVSNDANAFSAGFGIVGVGLVSIVAVGMFIVIVGLILKAISNAWNDAKEKAKLES